jgi:threonine synthase
MFIEGVKTVAYEIWEQLDFRAPEAIVLPVSYGSSLLGLYRGFNELLRGGEIERLPRLYAAQAANVAPLHHFSQQGTLDLDSKPTVAEGIAGTRPIRITEMLEAVTVSGGRTIPVEEEKIIPNLLSFASTTGLYVEPTSAVAIAAAEVLAHSGEIGDDTVVLLTGSGLKATERITSELFRMEGAKA